MKQQDALFSINLFQ